MARYTATQIAMVAWNVGIRDEPTIARAVAIALAESDGNTQAHNDDASTGDNSYGLWQINMIGAMGPARRAQFDIARNEDLFDPMTNGRAMYKISNGGRNWAPWSTFKNNAYMRHINTGKAAAKDVLARVKAASPTNPASWIFEQIAGVQESVGGVGQSIAKGFDVGGAISASFNSLSQSLMRLGLNTFAVIIAVILIVLAVLIMLRAPLGNAANKVAGVAGPGKVKNAATTVGKVVK